LIAIPLIQGARSRGVVCAERGCGARGAFLIWNDGGEDNPLRATSQPARMTVLTPREAFVESAPRHYDRVPGAGLKGGVAGGKPSGVLVPERGMEA
jgi:hypothetical protein